MGTEPFYYSVLLNTSLRRKDCNLWNHEIIMYKTRNMIKNIRPQLQGCRQRRTLVSRNTEAYS